MTAPVADVWAWVTDAVDAPFKWLTDYWTALIAFLVAPAVGIWEWLKGDAHPFKPISDAWTKLISIVTAPVIGVWDWLTTGVTGEDILAPARVAWKAVTDWAAALSLADSGKAVVATMAAGITAVGSGIKDALLAAFNLVKSLLPFSDATKRVRSRD